MGVSICLYVFISSHMIILPIQKLKCYFVTFEARFMGMPYPTRSWLLVWSLAHCVASGEAIPSLWTLASSSVKEIRLHALS